MKRLPLAIFFCVLVLIFSFAVNADTIKKQVKRGNWLVQFDQDEPQRGDEINVLDPSGQVIGTLRVIAVKEKRAVGRPLSGSEKISKGQKITLVKKVSSQKWFMGLHFGYAVPSFSYLANAISLGLELGKEFSRQMSGYLDVTTFSASGVRFIIPSLNLRFLPLTDLPLFIGAGAGVSRLSVLSLSVIDPLVLGFVGAELKLSPEFGIKPELWGGYVFAVDSAVSYQILQAQLGVCLYF